MKSSSFLMSQKCYEVERSPFSYTVVRYAGQEQTNKKLPLDDVIVLSLAPKKENPSNNKGMASNLMEGLADRASHLEISLVNVSFAGKVLLRL